MRSRGNSQTHKIEIDLTAENASTQCRCERQTKQKPLAWKRSQVPSWQPQAHLSGISPSNKRFILGANRHHRCQLNSHFALNAFHVKVFAAEPAGKTHSRGINRENLLG
jgi:hypothetical protein